MVVNGDVEDLVLGNYIEKGGKKRRVSTKKRQETEENESKDEQVGNGQTN